MYVCFFLLSLSLSLSLSRAAQVQELFARGEFAAALPVSKELRKRTFHHFGVRSPVFASAVNNQALILKNLGQLDESLNLFELAVRSLVVGGPNLGEFVCRGG